MCGTAESTFFLGVISQKQHRPRQNSPVSQRLLSHMFKNGTTVCPKLTELTLPEATIVYFI